MARFAEPDPNLVSATRAGIITAPGWARVGLTFGDSKLREAAIEELAITIAARIEHPTSEPDPAQLPLAL